MSTGRQGVEPFATKLLTSSGGGLYLSTHMSTGTEKPIHSNSSKSLNCSFIYGTHSTPQQPVALDLSLAKCSGGGCGWLGHGVVDVVLPSSEFCGQ